MDSVVIIGIFIGRFIYYYHKKINNINKKNQNTKTTSLNKNTSQKKQNILSIIGKNTLLLYVIHIPIIIIAIKIYMNYIK